MSEQHSSERWGSLAKPSPRRSLILFAIGAAVGLGLAAYGLFTATGTTTANNLPPQDIATVNGRHILRSDFITQTEITYAIRFADATPEQKRRVLDDMINEEILVQRGMEIDLPASDPDVRAAMVAGVNVQVTADIVASQPTEEELHAYYEQHMENYAGEGIMQLRDLYVRPGDNLTPPEARDKLIMAGNELTSGTPVDAVMMKYGLMDSGKIDPGDQFDFAAKIKLGPETYDMAAKLQANQVSEPFVLRGDINADVHIVYMIKRNAAVPRDFAAARDSVLQDLKRDATRKVQEENLNYLKQSADIVLAPEFRK